jgi:putative thioredoxin
MSAFALDVGTADFTQVVIEGSYTQLVLVDFWAEWCEPCKVLKPLLERLAEEYQGQFLLAKVNSEQHPAVAQKYGVRSIPSVMAFIDGERVDGFTGALPEGEIRAFLTRMLPSEADQLLRHAIELRAAGDPISALKTLVAAAEVAPDNENIRIEAADILLDQGQIDKARGLIDSLSPALRQEDRLKPLLNKLRFSDQKTGNEDELLARIAHDPNDHDARIALANLYIAQRRYEDGMNALLASIAADRSWNDGLARKTLLEAFCLTDVAPLVPTYRRKLASLLN